MLPGCPVGVRCRMLPEYPLGVDCSKKPGLPLYVPMQSESLISNSYLRTSLLRRWKLFLYSTSSRGKSFRMLSWNNFTLKKPSLTFTGFYREAFNIIGMFINLVAWIFKNSCRSGVFLLLPKEPLLSIISAKLRIPINHRWQMRTLRWI